MSSTGCVPKRCERVQSSLQSKKGLGKTEMVWARVLAYITGRVDQELLMNGEKPRFQFKNLLIHFLSCLWWLSNTTLTLYHPHGPVSKSLSCGERP